MTDLGPAADHLCALIEAVPDGDLGRPAPCAEYTAGDVLHHIAGVTVAFGGAAVKAGGESSDMGPWGDRSKLDPDWRTLPFEVDSATLVPLYDLVREAFGPGQDPAARGPARLSPR